MPDEYSWGMAASRLLAPDVSRGGMLLLIAVANIPGWVSVTPLAEATGVDQVLLLLKGMLIDQRVYPLFSMLAGFGVASIASRSTATVSASRLLLRRGLVLLGIGLLHGFLFPGDIIGAYGLTTVLLCVLVVRFREGGSPIPLALVGTMIMLLGLGITLSVDLSALPVDEANTPEFDLPNVVEWAFGTAFTVPFTAVLPCFVIGMFVWRSGVLASPERHRFLLGVTAVVGLLIAAATAWPQLAREMGATSGFAEFPAPMTLQSLGGYAGGLGWLALMTWCCVPLARREDGAQPTRQPWPLQLLVATGQRSMSCYLLQSVVFAVLFGVLLSQDPQFVLTPSALALVALLTWLGTMLFAWTLHTRGLRGPAEKLTRHLIYRGIERDSAAPPLAA